MRRKYVLVVAVVVIVVAIAIAVSLSLTTTKRGKSVDEFVKDLLGVTSAPTIKVEAPFSQGSSVPKEYTCDGSDYSPPLRISGVPSNAKVLVIILADPDAPKGTFIHWVLYDVSPSTTSIPPSIPRKPVVDELGYQAINDFGKVGYGGPCPPPGSKHRYVLIVAALSRPVELAPGVGAWEVIKALKGSVVAYGYTYGTYER